MEELISKFMIINEYYKNNRIVVAKNSTSNHFSCDIHKDKNINTNDIPKDAVIGKIIGYKAVTDCDCTYFMSNFSYNKYPRNTVNYLKEVYTLVPLLYNYQEKSYGFIYFNLLYSSFCCDSDVVESDKQKWLKDNIRNYELIGFRMAKIPNVTSHLSNPNPNTIHVKNDYFDELIKNINVWKYYPKSIAADFLAKKLSIEELLAYTSLLDETYEVEQKQLTK